MENRVKLSIDPGRVCFGLSRIGYTPATAICDIIDNSVQANASNIHIIVNKNREDLSDSRKNNVKEYLVIDDGSGMDEEEIKKSLTLGYPDDNYTSNSLSKFGLGLKSAAFSQGKELQVISSCGDDFNKYVVELTYIQQEGEYFATKQSLDSTDEDLIHKYLSNGKGTIVRITQIVMNNHPSVKNTTEELTDKLGVIYYYYLTSGLKIFIDRQESQEILPYDVLFTDEANKNGNLDENSWDGKTVQWIQKSKEITLDAELDVKAKIEVTQLPHPPLLALERGVNKNKIRQEYNIAAKNYGFYVYRNKRLISWAESFNGIVTQDQELYSFRGRILIDESADDCFNIDVKKSTITLSDEAFREISDRADEYKRKSRKAWDRAKNLKEQIKNSDPNSTSNTIVEDFEPPDLLPGEPIPSQDKEIERQQRQKEIEQDMQKKMRQLAITAKRELENKVITEEEIDNSDLQTAISGETNPESKKIFRVETIEDNNLWEPYYDAEHEHCVRINKYHRFAKVVFEDNSENSDLQIIFELLLLQLSCAEVYLQKSQTSYSKDQIRELITAYRRISSEYLADMCRQIGEDLPPIDNE